MTNLSKLIPTTVIINLALLTVNKFINLSEFQILNLNLLKIMVWFILMKKILFYIKKFVKKFKIELVNKKKDQKISPN